MRAPPSTFLPDFCTTPVVLTVMTIMQLVATLLLLATDIGNVNMWSRYLMLSLYLHWIGLCGAAALCQARRWLARAPDVVVVIASFLLLLLVAVVISELAWQIAVWRHWQMNLPDETHGAFIIRSLSVSGIVSLLVLRYLWLQNQWRNQVEAQAASRYQALQARIRPHFLFNSLNSIASLIGTRPHEAETAVEDLAQLFRAGLSEADRQAPLREEIEIARAYLRTESLRLGERLNVYWDAAAGLDELPVPSLCLQPLVENAVVHGIEPRVDGGRVVIKLSRSPTHLEIEVRNPASAQVAASAGTGTALDNIRERLRLMYGKKAELTTTRADSEFIARLTLPLAAREA